MRRWAELVGATVLLTRLPVGHLATRHPPAAACVWAYPVVGLLVGGAGAGMLSGLVALGLSQPVAAIWAVAGTILLTGGLHEDGLADTADGFGGGRDPARKLEIMRDSRIGSFGALALVLTLALRIVPLATMAHAAPALICAGVLGRGAMLLPLLLLSPARTEGLAASLVADAVWPKLCGIAMSLAAAWWSPRAGFAALAAGMVMALLSRRQVGGYTGDTLGATEMVAECAALSVLGT